MALMTVINNLPATQLNYLDFYYGYPGGPPVTNAIGGNLVNPVPYPFDWVQPFLANPAAGSTPGVPGAAYAVQLPVHESDMGFTDPNFGPLNVETLWNQLIMAGTVTVTFAAESPTNPLFFGDLFMAAVV
jgi:hypothetical protein